MSLGHPADLCLLLQVYGVRAEAEVTATGSGAGGTATGAAAEVTQEGVEGGDVEEVTERDALFQAPRDLLNETREALSPDGSEHSSVSNLITTIDHRYN